MTQPQRPYRPPSKRRLQVEARGCASLVIVGWCFVGGVWMGVKMLLALFSL